MSSARRKCSKLFQSNGCCLFLKMAKRESIEDFPGHENAYFSNLEDLSCFRSSQLPLSLKAFVKRFLGKQIHPSNLFQWLDIAEEYRIGELFQFTSSLICQHFIDLSSTEQFLSVDERRMRWIVRNEKLVTSEACLLEALIRWYKHSERKREVFFKELFSFIKLENINSEYLRNMIKKENLKNVLGVMDCVQRGKRKNPLLLRRRKKEQVEMEGKFSNVFVITSCIDTLRHLGERTETKFKIRYWQPFVGWTSDPIEYNLTGPSEEPLLCSGRCDSMHFKYDDFGSAELLYWQEKGQFLSSPVVIDNKLYILHNGFWCDLCHYPTALDGYVNDGRSAIDCYDMMEINFAAHLFCFDLSDHSCSIKAKLDDCRSSVLLRVGCYLYAVRQGTNDHISIDRHDTRKSCSHWESLTQSNNSYSKPSIVPYGIGTIFVAGSGDSNEKYDVFTDTWSPMATVVACVPQEWTPGFAFLDERKQPLAENHYSQVYSIYSQVWLRYVLASGKWEMRLGTLDMSDDSLLSLADHNFSATVAGRHDVKFYELDLEEGAENPHVCMFVRNILSLSLEDHG